MNRILITGGAGFIGSNLVSKILRERPDTEITVYDNFTVGKLVHLSDNFSNGSLSIVNGDVHDIEHLKDSMRGHQKVIHLAANSNISKASSDPTLDTREGTELAQNVFEVARLLDIHRIVYVSGSGVYGDTPDQLIDEDYSPLKPISTYGASKLACEALLSAYSFMFDIKSVIFRFANVVGPNQTHGVTLDFMRSLFFDKKKLNVLGDGTQSKMYVYVDDICNAILLAEDQSSGMCDVYNVGNDSAISVAEIAQMAVNLLGDESTQILYGAGARGWMADVPKIKLNSTKITNLGWKAAMTSEEAIQNTLKILIHELESGLHQ